MHNVSVEYANAHVRGYCQSQGLNRLETATCTRQAAVLIQNGNSRQMAVEHAKMLADRIKAKHDAERYGR